MIALLLAALPFIIQAAPVISAVAGVAGLIADLEAISTSPETPKLISEVEALFKKHGILPQQLSDIIKSLKPDGAGGWISESWAKDKRHQLNPDGTFLEP